MENKQWKIIVHEGGQIADTGDYEDGYYVLTNGEITLITKSVDEVENAGVGTKWMTDVNAEHPVVQALNATNAIWQLDNKYINERDHALCMMDTWKKLCEKMYRELKWASECAYEEASSADRCIKILKEYEIWAS